MWARPPTRWRSLSDKTLDVTFHEGRGLFWRFERALFIGGERIVPGCVRAILVQRS